MSELAVVGLSSLEETRLSALEAVIDRGRQTFIEVGNALLEIRDSRLYRETNATFEDYCIKRHGFERAHAYRLIDGAKVANVLSPIGDSPRNEAQTRELAPLLDEPELLRDAWKEANANGTATAAAVREAVAVRRPLDPDIMERHQRDTAVEVLDRSVYALESNIADIPIDWFGGNVEENAA